jgi:hypothetical protein
MHLKNLQEMTKINEVTSGGGFFTEAKGYSDSGEFTDEFYGLFQQSTKMKMIMKNQKWMDYMKMSDYHTMDSTCQDAAKDAIRAVIALENALQRIDKAFDKINGVDDDDGDDMPLEDPDALDPELDDDEAPSKGK